MAGSGFSPKSFSENAVRRARGGTAAGWIVESLVTSCWFPVCWLMLARFARLAEIGSLAELARLAEIGSLAELARLAEIGSLAELARLARLAEIGSLAFTTSGGVTGRSTWALAGGACASFSGGLTGCGETAAAGAASTLLGFFFRLTLGQELDQEELPQRAIGHCWRPGSLRLPPPSA